MFLCDVGHMTKMAAMPIYGKTPQQSSSLEQADQSTNFHEFWYVAQGTQAHHNLLK